MPVPRLRDTLDRYFQSLAPFAGEGDEGLHRQRAWADDLERSELGQELQRRVEGASGSRCSDVREVMLRTDLDRTAPSNWLDDSLWLRYAYHSARTPLPIHSNWWLMLAADHTLVAHPGRGDPQLARAAHLITRFLDFKLRIDRSAHCTPLRHPLMQCRQDIPPDSSRAGPFCMHQYRRCARTNAFHTPSETARSIFGVTRLPGLLSDTFAERRTVRHIVVIYREQFYDMDVLASDDAAVSTEIIYDRLSAIREDAAALSNNNRSARVASLTAGDRTSWAIVRRTHS